MKHLAFFLLGIFSALLLLIPIARLRQFILEPDYVPGFANRNNFVYKGKPFRVRRDGGEGP